MKYMCSNLLLYKKFIVRCSITLFISIHLLGCGGGSGSGGGSSSTPVTQPPKIVEYQPGVFSSSNEFYGLCEKPRVGIDGLTGLAFTDRQGTTTSENNWLRSWSNELYLWYDEIIDRNPASFSNTEEYFDGLKTIATTPSGNSRDNFHFSVDSQEWLQFAESGISSGYGVHFAPGSVIPPRKLVVAYVEADSPAAMAGLKRGSKIITVDGASLIYGNTPEIVDTLNDGLFPYEIETHSFTVIHAGSVTETPIVMTSSNQIEVHPVLQTSVLDLNENSKVGYIVFNEHIGTAEEELLNSFEFLKENGGSDALILDLRYNGGGYLGIAAQVGYMIAGPVRTADRTFELEMFNDKHPEVHPLDGYLIEPIPFVGETLGFSPGLAVGQALPFLDLNKVVIITGEETCSASEAIINGLRGINVEVVLIGGTTCGKPYGFYPQDNCGTTYFSIQFSGANDIGFSDYSDGFTPQNTLGFTGVLVPGCSVEDDFTHALGNTLEAKLATALQYLNTGSCPSASAISINKPPAQRSLKGLVPQDQLSVGEKSLSKAFLTQNRFVGLP